MQIPTIPLWSGIYALYNYTDHKPLTTILGPRSGIPTLDAEVGFYTFSIHLPKLVYCTSGNNANVNAMSRLPAAYEEEDIFQTTCLEEFPVRACDIKNATRVDLVLAKVIMYI